MNCAFNSSHKFGLLYDVYIEPSFTLGSIFDIFIDPHTLFVICIETKPLVWKGVEIESNPIHLPFFR